MTSPAQAQPAELPGPDSAFGPSTLDRRRKPPRPLQLGPRQRRVWLALLALACVLLALWVRHIAATPWIDAQWRADPRGAVVLAASSMPSLATAVGKSLVGIEAGPDGRLDPDAVLPQTLPRWQVDDTQRQRQMQQHHELTLRLSDGQLQLQFADGSTVTPVTSPRGLGGLGAAFWVCCAVALLLVALGLAVALAQPQPRNLLYLVMAGCQAGLLMILAQDSLPGVGTSLESSARSLWPSLALDALTAAAAVHALTLHPRRQPGAGARAAAVWLLALAWCGVVWLSPPAHLWWCAQALALASATAGWRLLGRSFRIEPNPFAALVQRLTGLVGLAMLLTTGLVATASLWPDTAGPVATLGAWAWSLGPSAFLLLAPFISRSRQVLREAALLATSVAIAAASNLLFVASLSLSRASAWMLAAALGLTAYLLARRWADKQVPGSATLDAERTFEQLYRAARALQSQPGRYRELLSQLLRGLFEPRELLPGQRDLAQSRVLGGGAALEVPLRGSSRHVSGQPGPTLVLRFAGGGQRLFTEHDARLADRVVERLRRAVAYDRAVERGRTEERQRIAQDLHDDIGARLLTLLYQAQTPVMEEYIRLTLKDLKTLTRGLSAGEHRLSHAAAEWKADLTQRLAAAQVQLLWSFNHDRDVPLSMVQWSALTRVLRELVSNALQHARASQVSVQLSLAGPTLLLRVADDGCGHAPDSWAHGLGLGGVRKRAKLIGGEVAWSEQVPQGIVCELRVAGFGGLNA